MGARMMPKPRGMIEIARERGQAAALAGEPRSANPYEDRRTERGGVTWSRGYRRAWFEGWDEAAAEITPTRRDSVR